MTGTVTLSVEIELGWGVHDIGEYGHLSEDGRAEREFLRKLLDVCDETEIPISFDAVGHLLLASCEGSHAGPYPDGWFDADPGTDVAVDPLFYAPDMIENVRARSTDHELCTHTFSRTPHGSVSTAAVDADLGHAQRVHEDVLGERTRSLVPPRHMAPPSHVLRSNGIDVVREAANRRASNLLGRAKELLLGPPPMGDPTIEDGVCRTLSTTYPNLAAASLPSGKRPAKPLFRAVPTRIRQRFHRQYLERATMQAIERDTHLHLWCHLYDIANDAQLAPLAGYLRTLERLRDRGRVDIAVMERLPERVPVSHTA